LGVFGNRSKVKYDRKQVVVSQGDTKDNALAFEMVNQ
jgi:hypothetical protein